MRMVDYSLNCITKLFNTGQVNADLQMEDEESDDGANESKDIESEMLESIALETELSCNEEAFWKDFDLKQEPYCPKLDLNLGCPLIIIPNLSEPTERFELDFGTIHISSELVSEMNRWVNYPQKPFKSMGVKVRNENLRFDFKKGDEDKVFQPILKEERVDIYITVPQSSPFFEDKNERGADLKPPVPVNDKG